IDQVVRQAVGGLVQLCVGEVLVPEHQGGRIRGAGHLGLEQLGEGRRRHVEGGVVPLHQHLVALVPGQDVDASEGAGGVGGDAGEQHLQVPHHALDGGGVEQVGVVLVRTDQDTAIFLEV